MTLILYICLAIWLAKAVADICAGLLRILACLATLLLSASFYLLAEAAEIFGALWMTAFPTNESPHTEK
jgi:hypothetical protein